jgi:hypothetical protein
MQAGTLTGFKGLDRDVLIRLSYEDLLNACSINMRLAAYCGDDNFWQEFVQNKFPSIRTIPEFILNDTVYEYTTWRNYAEVVFTNAQLFEVPTGTVYLELVTAIIFNIAQTLTVQGGNLETLDQLSKPYTQGIRRGDIVHFRDFGDELNNGKYIYNGQDIEPLRVESETDLDTAILPTDFSLMEFIDPGRWFNDNQLLGPPIVWCAFYSPLYIRIIVTPKYIVFRRDNIYYTIIPSQDQYPTTNMSLPSFLKNIEMLKKYEYYSTIDNMQTYDEIRDQLKGYILVVQQIFPI